MHGSFVGNPPLRGGLRFLRMTNGARDGGEPPLPGEALGTGFAGERRELAEFYWVVDIESDTRQGEYDAGLLGCLSCGEMRLETVIAKAEGE